MTDAEVPTQPVNAEETMTEVAEVAADPAVAQEVEEEAGETKQETTDAPKTTEGSADVKTSTDESGVKPMLATTGKHPRKAAEVNNTVTDDPVQIRKKAEYYFNDANFPEDKFLWEKMGGYDNKPFPIKTLSSFSRMRRFQPYSAVVAALKESDVLVVQGAEGEETVKRKTPYEKTTRKEVDAMTVYVKGFGDEQDGTQVALEDFFAPYEGILAVRLRREKDRSLAFKGSVWVVFESAELAQKFINLEPKPTYKGHELMIMSKPDYCAMKVEMIEKGEMEASKPTGTGPARFWQGNETGKPRGNQNGRGGNNNNNSICASAE
jgi:lupus La protein